MRPAKASCNGALADFHVLVTRNFRIQRFRTTRQFAPRWKLRHTLLYSSFGEIDA
jgi:hypothetical protein